MSPETVPTNMDWEEGARQINECEYLYVDDIREIEELTLQLHVTEAKLQAEILIPRDKSIVEKLVVGGRPIERDMTSRSFRLIFDRDHMVSYAVLNESFGKYPEPPELFAGKLFRVFSWSHLLEFTKQTTHACNESVLQHYQIACLNHVVDVICTGPPRIARTNGSSEYGNSRVQSVH